ncbi:MAG: BtaA family protein, partial [Bacteroidota bacterium]|nr:BtaA family protein [Bacteroidota bacterium]MDX5431113.1 BtaA family protein [Bacteroidota bacterium]MDX5469864.1 BtaA family protein [Bacteroidota bacterium]
MNLIRYSLVWEDYSAIEFLMKQGDYQRVAIITSAGCNALNLTLSEVKEIHAIDLNPIQNDLLAFKIHLIQNYPYEVFADLMGIHGLNRVQAACALIEKEIPEAFLNLLDPIREYGMASCGKLERYLHAFLKSFPQYVPFIQQLVQEPQRIQRQFILTQWLQEDDFIRDFSDYFNDDQLSQGRDPKLFKYTPGQGGKLFLRRFLNYLRFREGELPFIFRFFFFGMEGMPQHLLPPAYQRKNFEKLRKNLFKIKRIDAEAIEYTCQSTTVPFDALFLSNIFEYCDEAS